MIRSPALFFDRDRTLIADAPPGLASHAAHAPEHVVPLEGAFEAVRRARQAGFRVIVVTNQPGPAKGQYTRADVAATQARFLGVFAAAGAPIDAIFVCEHHPQGAVGGDPALIRDCDCRKPKPGLILQAARDLSLDLSRSALVGDEPRDLQAAGAAGIPAYRVGEFGVPVREAVERALAGLGASPRFG